MSRAMIHNKDVAKNLWGEAVNTACHIVNRVYFRLGTEKIPYELWKGRKPNVKYFRIIGSTCFILKDRENVGKFDSQSDEGIFLGYSSSSKAYKVFNKRTRKVMEMVNMVIDETSTPISQEELEQLPKSSLIQSFDADKRVDDPSPPSTPSVAQPYQNTSSIVTPNPVTPPYMAPMEREHSSRVKFNHPPDTIVGDMNELNLTKKSFNKYVVNFVSYSCYLSQIEHTKVEEALQYES